MSSTAENPRYITYQNKMKFITTLDKLMDIVEDIKDDERLKDQEYIDIMDTFVEFNKLKDEIKTTIIYKDIAKVKNIKKAPPRLMTLREKTYICGNCGRGFTTEHGLKEHSYNADVCKKTNQFAKFSIEKGTDNHDFYFTAKRVKDRENQFLLNIEQTNNVRARYQKEGWIQFTEMERVKTIHETLESLILDPYGG